MLSEVTSRQQYNSSRSMFLKNIYTLFIQNQRSCNGLIENLRPALTVIKKLENDKWLPSGSDELRPILLCDRLK